MLRTTDKAINTLEMASRILTNTLALETSRGLMASHQPAPNLDIDGRFSKLSRKSEVCRPYITSNGFRPNITRNVAIL